MLRPIPASNARTDLFTLLSGINANHEPVLITSKGGNGVLVAEEDWRGIEETLYLLSVPGMREALLEAKAEKPEDMARLEDL
jgi:prevent-host-death family protein